MTATFTKDTRPADQNGPGEAAGLRWLAAAPGGARVAEVIEVDDEHLVLERIEEHPATELAARAFGARLAHTHAAEAGWWGCPPDGWIGPDHVGNGRFPLLLDAEDAPDTWGEFYAEHRVRVFARRLRDAGKIDAGEASAFERVASRLEAGDLDAGQPALVTGPARTHGDLWTGNVLFDGTAAGAALIDPMAHGGHAETDLATLGIFGLPHLDAVHAGYQEASALAEGWRERIGLHQMATMNLHADVFGGGYVGAALDLVRRYR